MVNFDRLIQIFHYFFSNMTGCLVICIFRKKYQFLNTGSKFSNPNFSYQNTIALSRYFAHLYKKLSKPHMMPCIEIIRAGVSAKIFDFGTRRDIDVERPRLLVIS